MLSCKAVGQNHGRFETRRYGLSNAIDCFLDNRLAKTLAAFGMDGT